MFLWERKMKKSILFILHQNDFDGGASRSIIDIILKLKQENLYNIYSLLPSKGEISNVLELHNIEYYTASYKWDFAKKTPIYKWYLKKMLTSLWNKLQLIKIIKQINKKIDLVYSNTSVNEIGFFLSLKYKCPHIYHVREFCLEDFSLEYLHSERRRKKLLRLPNTKIIVISKALQSKYEKLTSRNDISLIYNGLNNTFKEKEYIPKQKVTFLFIGSINRGKNQLDALKAAVKLLEKGITNFTIKFIGTGNIKYKAELEQYINLNKLVDHVLFLGHKNQDDLIEIVYNADVGLMLSSNEAFGRVTVEYMLGGLPVIASNAGANPELVISNENGYLYNSNDLLDLTEKMKFFIKNPLKIIELGKKGREIAIKNYDLNTTFNKIKQVIEEQI